MLIDALTFSLEKSSALDSFWAKIDRGQDAQIALASSARPFILAAQFTRAPRATLCVLAGEEAAFLASRSIAAYLGDERVFHFAERKEAPFQFQTPDPRCVSRRLQAIHQLMSQEPSMVVASAAALTRALPPKDKLLYKPLRLFAGVDLSDTQACEQAFLDHETKRSFDYAHPDPIPGEVFAQDPSHAQHAHKLRDEFVLPSSFEALLEGLVAYGYQQGASLEGPGSFCVHGDVVDVFPGNLDYPVRLDFFADELEEIRRIVPSTGQTISSLDVLDIFAVQEFVLGDKERHILTRKLQKPSETNPVLRELLDKLNSAHAQVDPSIFLPYLFQEKTCLGALLPQTVTSVLFEPRSIIDDARHTFDALEKASLGTQFAAHTYYLEPQELNFGSGQQISYLSIMRAGAGALDGELVVKRSDVAGASGKLFGKLHSLIEMGYVIVFSAPQFRARQDMKMAFVDEGLPIVEVLDVNNSVPARLRRGVVNIVDVDIPLGMIIPDAKLALISISDTQGAMTVSTRRRYDATEFTFPFKPGDYVVHASHGIAFFRSIERMDVGGVERDYLLLEYAENDKLYVPVEQLDRVTRYVGPEGSAPKVTRLHTADWSRAITKARKATQKLAFDLVDVYTRRMSVQGYRYGFDTPAQKEMEADFPYNETSDQLSAISDIKSDMQSARPMDRLVCGDVGFGKTEVALRAAFKATQDKKQVMVLCPTTILAQQHYINFKERFEPYGVVVEVLSRFRTQAQIKHALEGFEKGEVDVLVGTHRLLSRDVNPHDLGLLIIDEEQRFGVGHKEQMKSLRESVDVLTLSATPIPRTLQMSLSGVRDMSLILTPPDQRRPVKVQVGEWDPDLVSAAIRRELERGGQVYYVSNRVRSIEDAVERVARAAGEARIGVAHGQQTKEQLESVMEEFAAGELDVLVATTIIESGIDNPHTNTLIIEDAQRLGLAQMYQLKGRVGRSNTQAYAYFMFPERVNLTEEATARLTAINEHTDLGSGMKIALRDLEIRGAGSLMGAEQSGNMSAVGFDLFASLLAEAVDDARQGVASTGELSAALSDIAINLPVHAYIPESYIKDPDARILYYRKIALCESVDAVLDLEQEVIKHFGEEPAACANLFTKAKLRALAFERGYKNISVAAGKLTVEPINLPKALPVWMRRAKMRYVSASHKLTVPREYFKETQDKGLATLILEFMQALSELGSSCK